MITNGRKKFDHNLYNENDRKGKAFAVKALSLTKQFADGKFNILDIAEDKKCGDVKIELENGKIISFEIECSGADRFNKNFLGQYPEVNVPDKFFDQIPGGKFIAFDSSEDENTEVPRRFYTIDVEDILHCERRASVNKYSDGKQEFFYKIPSDLVKRFEWNEEKQKYERYYP